MQFENEVPDNSHALMVISMPNSERGDNNRNQFAEIANHIMDINAKKIQEKNIKVISEITIVLSGNLRVPYILLKNDLKENDAIAIGHSLDENWFRIQAKFIRNLKESGIIVNVITWETIKKIFAEDIKKHGVTYNKELDQDEMQVKFRNKVANIHANKFWKQVKELKLEYSACLNTSLIYLDEETIFSSIFSQFGKHQSIHKILDIEKNEITLKPFTFEAYAGEQNELMKYYRNKHNITHGLPWITLQDCPLKPSNLSAKKKAPSQKEVSKKTHIISEHEIIYSNAGLYETIYISAFAILQYDSVDYSICMKFVNLYIDFLLQFKEKHLQNIEKANSSENVSTLLAKLSVFETGGNKLNKYVGEAVVRHASALFKGNITPDKASIFEQEYLEFLFDFKKTTFRRS